MSRLSRIVAAGTVAMMLTACAKDSGRSASPTTRVTTSTTTQVVNPSTTVTSSTTTAPTTTATSVSPSPCQTGRGGTPSSTVRQPSAGTYLYASCSPSSAATTTLRIASEGAAVRTPWNAPFSNGTLVANRVVVDGSVVEPSAVFSLNTTTLQCDWDPDLAVYPARLSVGVSWRADGRCSMEFGQSFQVNRSSQVTGTRSFAVSGTAVDTWVVEETLDFLYVDNPRRASTTWHRTLLGYLDPQRGVNVYERSTSEATGQYPQRKTTVERYLKSVIPAT